MRVVFSRGVTLIELMVVIAILAILAGIAAPNFAEMIAAQRVKDAAFELQATFMFARSEATKRNAFVTISPVSGQWGQGWTIPDPRYAGSFIQRRGTLASDLTLTPLCGASTINYDNLGRLDTAKHTNEPRIDVASQTSNIRRCIQIGLNGRPAISTNKCATSCS